MIRKNRVPLTSYIYIYAQITLEFTQRTFSEFVSGLRTAQNSFGALYLELMKFRSHAADQIGEENACGEIIGERFLRVISKYIDLLMVVDGVVC